MSWTSTMHYAYSTISVSNEQKRQCCCPQKCPEIWGSFDPLSDLIEATSFKSSDFDHASEWITIRTLRHIWQHKRKNLEVSPKKSPKEKTKSFCKCQFPTKQVGVQMAKWKVAYYIFRGASVILHYPHTHFIFSLFLSKLYQALGNAFYSI